MILFITYYRIIRIRFQVLPIQTNVTVFARLSPGTDIIDLVDFARQKFRNIWK